MRNTNAATSRNRAGGASALLATPDLPEGTMALPAATENDESAMFATLYEVPIGGAQVAVFVVILLGSLVVAVGVGTALERSPAKALVWNVPLFTLGLWACLGLGCALLVYGN